MKEPEGVVVLSDADRKALADLRWKMFFESTSSHLEHLKLHAEIDPVPAEECERLLNVIKSFWELGMKYVDGSEHRKPALLRTLEALKHSLSDNDGVK